MPVGGPTRGPPGQEGRGRPIVSPRGEPAPRPSNRECPICRPGCGSGACTTRRPRGAARARAPARPTVPIKPPRPYQTGCPPPPIRERSRSSGAPRRGRRREAQTHTQNLRHPYSPRDLCFGFQPIWGSTRFPPLSLDRVAGATDAGAAAGGRGRAGALTTRHPVEGGGRCLAVALAAVFCCCLRLSLGGRSPPRRRGVGSHYVPSDAGGPPPLPSLFRRSPAGRSPPPGPPMRESRPPL